MILKLSENRESRERNENKKFLTTFFIKFMLEIKSVVGSDNKCYDVIDRRQNIQN